MALIRSPKIRISAPGITSAIVHYSRIPLVPTHGPKPKESKALPHALCCRVHTHLKAVSKYKTVRAWVTRRVKNAITEALRDRGFDRLGRRAVLPEEYAHHRSAGNLAGTVIIQPNSSVVTIKFEALKKEMGLVVDNIAKACSKKTAAGIGNGEKTEFKTTRNSLSLKSLSG
jgi:hypothetical protein